VLGVLGRVAELFGVRRVQLDAEDSGSGKLVQYYQRIGFEPTSKACTKKDLAMEASIGDVAQLAPPAWLRGMVPPAFDAPAWLWSQVSGYSLDQLFNCMCIPRNCAWPVAWPEGARLEVALKVASSCGKIDIDMRMLSAFDVELACARGALRVRPGALRVIWLGRSGAQPVHPSVAGQARLPTKTQHQGVTPAAALLGAMGVLALAFACPTAEIVACDDGSGRLLQYLQRLGFDRASEEPDAAAAGTGEPVAVSMRATCSALVEGCCPPEWVPELPAAGQYSMFASISR